MPKKQKKKRKIQHKSRWSKRLSWITCIIVLAMIVIAAAGKFWLIPAIVHSDVEKTLKNFWAGNLDIEGIEVNYFGPIYLGKVRLTDKTGKAFLHTGTIKMVFAKWPGLHPVLTEIEIEGLNLQISGADGKFTLPFVYPSKQQLDLKKRLDIRKLTINDAEITVTDAQGTKTLYDNLQLLATKKGNFYNFLLNRIDSWTSESLLAKSKIDLKTLETELSLQMKHTVKRPEMALVFAALNIPKLSAEGKLVADLTITGCLKEPRGLKPDGIISFDGWTVMKIDKIIANNLITKANIKNRRFDFNNITATFCNGSATGSLYVEAKQNELTEFRGQVSAQKISFIELTSLLGNPAKTATKGSVTFNYNFSGKGKDMQNLSGQGQIFLDDADISVIPIVPHIFRNIGLAQLDPLKMSDTQCTFTTAGPVVTIKTAHIANRFAAIKAEPGGTINLKTKQINMYVIAAPLKQLDAVIKKIPIVNIIANFKDKLTRLYVRGNWSDPPAKLITKEPIKDIKEGTIGFLQDVVKSGGQITQEMRKRFGIFSRPEKEVKTNSGV